MNEVVYVDVLFILNFFVTYLLLLTTKYLLKREAKQWRLVCGALAGAAYSMVILIPTMPAFFSFAGKFLSAAAIVLVAFSFQNKKQFLRGLFFFFAAGFLYVGIMIAMWLTFKPKGLIINNACIYFQISPELLVFSSLIAYLVSTLIIKIHNRVTAKKQLYHIEITHKGKSVQTYGFVDSGNKLREPFSGAPVIVMDAEVVNGLFTEESVRVIPYHTIGEEGILNAYRAQEVKITSGTQHLILKEQYIAISRQPLNGEYKGLIHPELLNI